MVCNSECLHHDTVAVHLFQQYIFLTEQVHNIKIKNFFINLTHHLEDFKINAEWTLFPTSHGKESCDGIGGTLKRLAARASLQRVNNPIRTPKELFNWTVALLSNIS